MDLSFDFKNRVGDHLKIALSDYDSQILKTFTDDPQVNSLTFYNLSLERKEKKSRFLNPHLLYEICDYLLQFLINNPNVILTYLCDPKSEVERSHQEFSPQEYRSNLFNKLFDYFTYSKNIDNYIDEVIYIPDANDKFKDTYVHFIYNKIHKPKVEIISKIILEK